MTQSEYEYLQRAVEALGSSDTTPMAKAKILRIMSQICDRCSDQIEQNLVDKVEERLYN
jgi:Mg-chelatase subunit ChlD